MRKKNLYSTVNDLFYYSSEADVLDDNFELAKDKRNFKEQVEKQAVEWLKNYPYFQQFTTSKELAKNYLKRY